MQSQNKISGGQPNKIESSLYGEKNLQNAPNSGTTNAVPPREGIIYSPSMNGVSATKYILVRFY